MKPISVEMSAFGPYKDAIKIDFTKIGENGIFLITGDTGAGKTTIFDAIVFALYGSVSGSNRQVATVRSDFADDATETYVEFVFSHKGKEYKIRRNPAYERLKKRGEGTAQQMADASIECADKVLATGLSNVDMKVKEILNIDEKQFKQISMLAQGEFLKILFAESKERTEIFRKIFDTYIYEDIKNKLNEKQKEAYANLNSIKTKIFTNTQNVSWKKAPEFISVLNEKTIHNYIKEILEFLEIEVEENKEELKTVEEKVNALDKEQKDKELKLKNAEEINSSFIKLDSLIKMEELQKSQIVEYDNKQKQVDRSLKIQTLVLPKAEALKKVENNIEILKKDIEKNAKILEDLDKIQANYFEKDKKILEIKNNFEGYIKLNNEIEKYALEIKNIENIEVIINTIEKDKEKINALKEKEEKVVRLKDILKEYELLNKNVEEVQQKLKKALEIEKQYKEREKLSENFERKNEEFRVAEDNYKIEENKFYREQAGVLAEKLEEGKPCPVCGSVHHPELAEKSDALTKEELDNLKEKLQKIEKEKNSANEKLTIKNTQIDTLVKELEFDNLKLTVIEYISKLKEEEEKVSENIKQKFEEINSIYMCITSESIEISKFDYDKFKIEFDKEVKEISEKIARNSALFENFMKSMKKELSEKTELKEYSAEVRNKYDEVNKNLKEHQDKIIELYFDIEDKKIKIEDFDFEKFKEDYEKEKQEHLNKIVEAKTKQTEFSKQLENQSKESDELKKEYENTYKTLKFESEEEYKKEILDENSMKTIQKEIDDYKKVCTETSTKISELKEQLKDKTKTNLDKDVEELEILNTELKKQKEEQLNINSRYSINKPILKLLKADADEVVKQIELYNILDELYKTASGTLNGKRRIEFEQYVQAAFFDRILNEANKRLEKMTNGRFELVRKEKAIKKTDKIGLDL